MTTATWTDFQASQKSDSTCDGQYPYFGAEFRCGDQEPAISVGFRRKRDRSETLQKLPIKLDFNWSVQGQRWPVARGDLGFRKLSLNSGQADDAGLTGGIGVGRTGNPGVLSALLTEQLAWRLMREEVPEVSRVAYVRLTLHFTDTGATLYQGLYVLVEDIDRTAVRARFGADKGLLVKTTDLGCVDEVEYDDGMPNSASELLSQWLALKPSDFPGSWYERTNQALHLDMLLRQEALRELLANTADTVLGNRNNYYALDLHGQRRWFLPWDLDDMFRPFPQVRAPDTALVRGCTGAGGCTPNPVGLNIRDNGELRPRYLEIMCRLTNGVAMESKVLAQFQAIDQLIRPIVAAEVQNLWAPKGLDPLNVAVEGTYAAEFERLKTWIPARIQAVRKLIAAEGVSCSPGCQDGARVACDYFGNPSQRVCTQGSWAACEAQGLAPGSGGAPGTGTGGSGSGGGSSMGGSSTGGTGGRSSAGGSTAAGTGGASMGGSSTGGIGGGSSIAPGGAGGSSLPGVSGSPGRAHGCACASAARSGPGGVTSFFPPSLAFLLLRWRRSGRPRCSHHAPPPNTKT